MAGFDRSVGLQGRCSQMSPIEDAYLLQQFQLIQEYLSRAKRIAGRTKEEFLSDPIAIDAAIRELTVLFETSHNIAKHIIACNGWRNPTSKAETFEVLAEMGVLPNSLADSFRQASRFRNLVTYQTALIEEEIVYRILRERLIDFESFVSHVAQWLKKAPKG